MAQEIWTIGRILKWTENYFSEKGLESPRLDAEVLLSHVLKKERIYLYVHFDEPLESAELVSYRNLIKQRVKHVPVAYLTGSREFMGLNFKVTPAVLIPRPETELLVQTAIEGLREMKGEKLFADIGAGSGAICISVLHYVPDAKAEAVDISEEALKIAKMNAELLGVADRITFHRGDILGPLKGKRFNAVLSNPPYIPDGDIKGLLPEVREAEPKLALAGGADGLDFYRHLAGKAQAYLEDNGFLAMELGISQAESVCSLLKTAGMSKTEVYKDLAGIERVAVAWK